MQREHMVLPKANAFNANQLILNVLSIYRKILEDEPHQLPKKEQGAVFVYRTP